MDVRRSDREWVCPMAQISVEGAFGNISATRFSDLRFWQAGDRRLVRRPLDLFADRHSIDGAGE
jgi:hypothetical protein